MESARCKAFAASVDTGSFTKAAERLNYTPSGVCQLVNALEKEFGFPLLLRDKKGVRPTADGEKILAVIRDFLQQEERLVQMAAEINGLAVGQITIGAYSSIATHWLPPVIKGFQEAYPRIEIHMMEGTRPENEEWLANKLVDMAFFSYKKPMEYYWIPLADDPLVAVLPPSHPMAHEEVYPLKNCVFEKFIMPGLGRDDDTWEMFNQNHLTPQIAFSTLENFSALAMIEQGMGMSIMNSLITQRWNCDVVKLPLDPPQSIQLGIAIPMSKKNISPAAVRFIEYAVQRLKVIE